MTAPITPDERDAMRGRADGLRALALNALATPTEHAYSAHVPRLLDALDTAEAEVERLREAAARPAPAWDEDTVRAEAIRAVESVPATTTFSWPHAVDVILAVVREHLPVRPNRETIADVLIECGTWCGMADVDHEDGPCPACVERARGDAHAVLALWPGESRATVQAEALRNWISEWPTTPGDGTFLADVARDGLARADRLEGGTTP